MWTILKFHYKLTRITGTLREDLCTIMILCLRILLVMTDISDNSVQKIEHTHFLFSNYIFIYFLKLCRLYDNV